jgi:hypothetical protein
VSIDKVIVNTLNTSERLAAAKDRKNRLGPVISYLQQGITAVKTLVVIRAMGTSGLRVIQQLAVASGEVEAELALAERDIAHLEKQQAIEELVVRQNTKKGGRRVSKH